MKCLINNGCADYKWFFSLWCSVTSLHFSLTDPAPITQTRLCHCICAHPSLPCPLPSLQFPFCFLLFQLHSLMSSSFLYCSDNDSLKHFSLLILFSLSSSLAFFGCPPSLLKSHKACKHQRGTHYWLVALSQTHRHVLRPQNPQRQAQSQWILH